MINSERFTISKKEAWVLILCVLIGFALRFYTFDQKSLWTDEVHTFNESRDDIGGQLKFYKENPTHLHPPLFFILTHLFYPFPKPERDLRIIPLLFGTLSIFLIYYLSRPFSPRIAIPCSLSIAFMVYHINLSQDARSYSLLMFFSMAAGFFFIHYRTTLKKKYLLFVAIFFALSFHTSYSSIPFIVFLQLLWFYCPDEKHPRIPPQFPYSFLILNGFTLLFCFPWILFVVLNFKESFPKEFLLDLFSMRDTLSLSNLLWSVLHDWVPFYPLMIVSTLLLALFPIFSKDRGNSLVLLALIILPVLGLYLFCKLLGVTHFISTRYFVCFLPFFLITLFIALDSIEVKFGRLKKFVRLKILLVIFFISTNLVLLPLYYLSEKQDFRGLVTYLKKNLKEGDKIFVEDPIFAIGILHYFGQYPTRRHHLYIISNESRNEMKAQSLFNLFKEIEFRSPFVYQDKTYIIYHYKTCCEQYVSDGSRLWIIVGKSSAKKFQETSPSVLKGYFDGSFLTTSRFPTDGSLYLFLWDPKSPDEMGNDLFINRKD